MGAAEVLGEGALEAGEVDALEGGVLDVVAHGDHVVVAHRLDVHQCPAVGELEAAGLLSQRTCKGASLMTEPFALE